MVFVALLFFSVQSRFPGASSISEVIRVPADYPTIQSAIDVASPKSVILVKSGVYEENLVINKSLSLLGENKMNTVINGSGQSAIVTVNADEVIVDGFTIQNRSLSFSDGVLLNNAEQCTISGNIIVHNGIGVTSWNSHNNVIAGNIIAYNGFILPVLASSSNILLFDSNNNSIVDNIISNGVTCGINLVNSNNTTIQSNTIENNEIGLITVSALRVAQKTVGFDLAGPIGTMGYFNTNVDKGIFGGVAWKDWWQALVPWKVMLNNTDITKQTIIVENQTHASFIFTHNHGFSHVQITHLFLRVPQDYSSLQAAANAALSGSVISVDSGTYHGQVLVTKSLTILGEDKSNTVLDADGKGAVIRVITNNVWIDSFTIRNCSSDNFNNVYSGIFLCPSSNSRITNNLILHNGPDGIRLEGSDNNLIAENIVAYSGIDIAGQKKGSSIALSDSHNNTITDNVISDSLQDGINLSNSHRNTILSNVIENNQNVGIDIQTSQNNTVALNSFISDQENHVLFSTSRPNSWSESGIGNYWDDYTGLDDGSDNRTVGDGVGDTDLPHLGVDSYPLVRPPKPIPIIWDGNIYPVTVEGNSTISMFRFLQAQKEIMFSVTGPEATAGYCNITIPKNLLRDDPWTILLNGRDITSELNVNENETHSFLYFTYDHSSISNIQITGTWVVPEFFPKIIPTAMLLSSAMVTILRKRKRT